MDTEISNDVGTSPVPESIDSGQSSSPIAETSEQVAGGVSTSDGEQTVQEADPFEGVPTLEELQAEVEQRVPHSEALLRLRTELERIKPIEKEFQPWKDILAEQTPDRVKEQLQFQDQFFSPVVKDGQPVFDTERGLPQYTAQPFLDSMEAKQPGFVMSHFLDVVDYQATNPTTGQKEPLIQQFFRDVLGLDVGKLEQYQQIDSLIAKTNGGITPEELDKVPETDREVYKSLPSGLRKDWEYMDEETRKFHLDGARNAQKFSAFMEQQQQAQKTAEQTQRQQFEAQIEQTFVQDLGTVREQAFTSLRDNLARAWQPSSDNATNQDRYDDVIAPLIHLVDPDLQSMALKRLEREGIKIDAKEFNENMQAMTGARQTYVRAQAYRDGVTADRALRDFNRLQTQMMAKFNNVVLERAKRYGYQAQQIAEAKGELLTTASAVRPNINGNSAVGQNTGYRDPRSTESMMADWEASRAGRTA